MKLKKLAISTATTLAFLVPAAVMAQVNTIDTDTLGLNEANEGLGMGSKDIRQTVGSVIRAFMGLLGIVAVVIILLGGFKWMTSGGEEAKVSEAKKLIISGVIGLIIILAAFAIATFVVNAIVNGTR
jgi:amino acid transporter